jgi:predicted glycogen debranching enzyme
MRCNFLNPAVSQGYTSDLSMATSEKQLVRTTVEQKSSAPAAPTVTLEGEICNDLAVAEQREWLVTNGIGGFASGTVSGNLTRRYHGLLIAALNPPVGRTQLVAKVEEVSGYAGSTYSLATNRWNSGATEPRGYVHIRNFRLEGTVPVWQFALGDALLEKRIWMRQGENTTYVRYRVLRGTQGVRLRVAILVNYRDYHSTTHAGNWQMNIAPVADGIQVHAFEGAVPFRMLSAKGEWQPYQEWHRDCFLLQERYRGLDDHEDHLHAATLTVPLTQDESATLAFTTEPNIDKDGERALEAQQSHDSRAFSVWRNNTTKTAGLAPAWIRQLLLAADQFIVKRSLPDDPHGRSIIAGYPWFADWGRDTMIALPGLTIATGRPEIAKQILLSFSRYVDGGMLPNNFPDAGGRPDYNTVDATFWYIEAIRQYYEATQDRETLTALFPTLLQIIDGHLKGTRYSIHVDASDGLLYAGEPGVQLTWMDARVGGREVTPRIGKPIEINALWYNALHTLASLAPIAGKTAEPFAKMAKVAENSFLKFWNASAGYCYDVIDSPGIGADATLRPNQIFAVSLPKSPLTTEQQRSVVDMCAQRLLTPHGLRSLDPRHSAYQGHYGGNPAQRDGAYHQGTAWAWLLGPFALAHFRVYGDRNLALSFVELVGNQIHEHGLGTLSEIADGDAPFTPRGCIAQAWTVAEVLRVWHFLQSR